MNNLMVYFIYTFQNFLNCVTRGHSYVSVCYSYVLVCTRMFSVWYS